MFLIPNFWPPLRKKPRRCGDPAKLRVAAWEGCELIVSLTGTLADLLSLRGLGHSHRADATYPQLTVYC